MEPIDYGGALRRSWRLLIALAILGAVIAVLIPASHAKKVKSSSPYQAVSIVGAAPNGPNSPVNGTVTSNQIQFYANTTEAKQTTVDDSNLDSALPADLSAVVVPSVAGAQSAKGTIKRSTPTVVELTAIGDTSADAAALVNAYAFTVGNVVAAAATERQGQNPRFQGGNAYTGYTILLAAQGGYRAVSPKASLGASRKVRGGAGLVIGALVGAAIVLLRELVDKRLRNAARAEANFGFPVVAEIPTATLGPASPVAGPMPMVDVIRDPHSPGAEAYRMLRVSVMFEGLASLSGPTDPYAMGFEPAKGGMLQTEQPVDVSALQEVGDRRVILVVSASSEPSRPYVAANLAAIYAEAGERVVVISTGEVEAWSNGSHPATLTGDIRTEDIEAHLEPSRLEHVSRLPLSPFISRSGQLVTRMPAVLEATRPASDVIIVEVPPLLTVHHAEALVRCADVVLVVAECRVTTFDHARRAGDLLRRMGAPVLGVVLTGTRLDRSEIRSAQLDRSSTADDETGGDRESVVAIGAGVGSSSEPTSDSPA